MRVTDRLRSALPALDRPPRGAAGPVGARELELLALGARVRRGGLVLLLRTALPGAVLLGAVLATARPGPLALLGRRRGLRVLHRLRLRGRGRRVVRRGGWTRRPRTRTRRRPAPRARRGPRCPACGRRAARLVSPCRSPPSSPREGPTITPRPSPRRNARRLPRSDGPAVTVVPCRSRASGPTAPTTGSPRPRRRRPPPPLPPPSRRRPRRRRRRALPATAAAVACHRHRRRRLRRRRRRRRARRERRAPARLHRQARPDRRSTPSTRGRARPWSPCRRAAAPAPAS